MPPGSRMGRSGDGKVIRDFFMIIKCPNIYPEAKNKKALVLAGCHGLGTWVAGLALKKLDILKKIEEKVGGDFQAVGSVTSDDKGFPDISTIKVGPIVSF